MARCRVPPVGAGLPALSCGCKACNHDRVPESLPVGARLAPRDGGVSAKPGAAPDLPALTPDLTPKPRGIHVLSLTLFRQIFSE